MIWKLSHDLKKLKGGHDHWKVLATQSLIEAVMALKKHYQVNFVHKARNLIYMVSGQTTLFDSI